MTAIVNVMLIKVFFKDCMFFVAVFYTIHLNMIFKFI